MDKEQAIELLEHLAWDRDIDRNLYGEALNMAIDALKAQLSMEDATKGATSDLIDRKAALKAINSWRGRFSEEYNEAIDDCENSIKELPTIQPEPKERHWIRTDCGLDVECKCSACGYKDFVSPHDTYWFKRNYRPNCGAKMKGERQK